MDKDRVNQLLNQLEEGFKSLSVGDTYKKVAMNSISLWLNNEDLKDYHGQMGYLIESKKFNALLDSFYQYIPFGTGGPRGPVGIGTNRFNPRTVQASVQGHCNYLLDLHGESICSKGIVLCYDVRKNHSSGLFSEEIHNPIEGITSREFCLSAAQVYTANGFKCYLFDDVRATPELSFAIRNLGCISGLMMSASHNPKGDNGLKLYADHGGQLIPPHDQVLADKVQEVEEIKTISLEEAQSKNLLILDCCHEVDNAYIEALSSISILEPSIDRKNIKIVYSPLHGVGTTSVYNVLVKLGFDVVLDELTSTPDGAFPNIKFNIPNPEVVESMETLVNKGKKIDADVLISTDPDADRLGIMVKVSGDGASNEYRYFNGNEIGILLTYFLFEEMSKKGISFDEKWVAKTTVTSELINRITEDYGANVDSDLLVGFKYIAELIKKLEDKGKENDFVLGIEESHGYLIGPYTRDKDGACAALILSELACLLKSRNINMDQYLDEIYMKYGYFFQKQSSLIFLGAEGREKIDKISSELRKNPPKVIGDYEVIKYIDRWKEGGEILSDTDKSSRNVQTFIMKGKSEKDYIKLTLRPSGTEPKMKIYIEVGENSNENDESLMQSKLKIKEIASAIIDEFTLLSYQSVGIKMPRRGLLLSSLLPVEVRVQYFEIENELINLESKVKDNLLKEVELVDKMRELLFPFGKDPIEKITHTFEEQRGISLREFIENNLKIDVDNLKL